MVRYDSKLNKELARVVKNYNSKLSRLEKKGISVSLEKITVKEIKGAYTSRRDVLSYMRELRRFSRQGAEQIVYTDRYGNEFTRYDFSVGYYRQRRAIRLADSLIDKAKKTKRTEGGEEGYQSLMGTDYVNNLEANVKTLKSAGYNRRVTSAKKATILRASRRILGTKKYQFAIKENFYSHLESLAEVAGFDESKVSAIEDALSKVEGRDFEVLRSSEELVNKIEEYYPRLKDCKNAEDRRALGANVLPLLEALYDNINNIVADYIAED